MSIESAGAGAGGTHSSFLSWMRDRGFKWNSDAVLAQEHKVVTGRALSVGETVCVMPKASMLTVRTSSAASILEAAGLTYGHFPGEERGAVGLAIALMRERSLGGTSAWAPYLATLDWLEPVPLCWGHEVPDGCQEALQVLQGTEVSRRIQSDRAELRQDYALFIKPLSDKRPDMFPPTNFKFEAYVAARTILASRAFTVDSYHGSGLVPFADLFNHDSCEQVHFTSAGDVCRCCGLPSNEDQDSEEEEEERGDIEDQNEIDVPDKPKSGLCPVCDKDVSRALPKEHASISMIACRKVKASKEIFNTYGRKGNIDLLLSHGFTLYANPFSNVNLWVDPSTAFAPFCDDLKRRINLAEQIGLASPSRNDSLLSFNLEKEAHVQKQHDCDEKGNEETEYDEHSEEESDAEFCPFPQELLFLVNLVCADKETFQLAERIVQELETKGQALVPVLDVGSVNADSEGENEVMDDVESALWQLFANASLRGGYLQGPPAAPFAFLLRAPGVADLLNSLLQAREADYDTQDTLDSDRERLAQLRPASAQADTGAPPPAEMSLDKLTHALQVRLSERSVLEVARQALAKHTVPIPEQTPAKRPSVGDEHRTDSNAKRAKIA